MVKRSVEGDTFFLDAEDDIPVIVSSRGVGDVFHPPSVDHASVDHASVDHASVDHASVDHASAVDLLSP